MSELTAQQLAMIARRGSCGMPIADRLRQLYGDPTPQVAQLADRLDKRKKKPRQTEI
jgi:hypothetical protein